MEDNYFNDCFNVEEDLSMESESNQMDIEKLSAKNALKFVESMQMEGKRVSF